MRPYNDYVNHMLRLHFARDETTELSEVDQVNCEVCDRILRQRSDEDREILRRIYTDKAGSMAASVRKCADHDWKVQQRAWSIIRAVTQEIARERGLIE